jgi:hypothetical protein
MPDMLEEVSNADLSFGSFLSNEGGLTNASTQKTKLDQDF